MSASFFDKPRRVIIESPYAGDVAENLRYLCACIADCVRRNESPYASHWMIAASHALDDLKPEERTKGIRLGFAWHELAEKSCVYVDRGISAGMRSGMSESRRWGLTVVVRSLDAWRCDDTSKFLEEATRYLDGLSSS